MQSSKSSSSSSVTESSGESDTEKVQKTVRRNYYRTHATDNMRNTGIYNGAILNQYRRQQIVYQPHQHQKHYHQQQYQQQHYQPQYQPQSQQHHYRHSTMQGYDNFAYSQCSYVPSYYGQYSTHSNFSYPHQYVQPLNKSSNEYLQMRYAVPIMDQNGVKCVKREIPNSSYTYYDYQYAENIPITGAISRYSCPSKTITESMYQKNSTATTLNFDYQSQNNSMILNDVPRYEMTNHQQEQEHEMQTNQSLKRVASENSLKFINIAAVGGTANLSKSSHSINKNKKFEDDHSNSMNDLQKGQINFLNFDKKEKKKIFTKKCSLKKLLFIILVIILIMVFCGVMFFVLLTKGMIFTILI